MVCSVVFLALPLAVQVTFTPTDTPALQAALVSWCSNSTAARADYGPIGEWDVSLLTDLSMLVYNAPCHATFNEDINGWNVGRVTSLTHAFAHVAGTSFNQPLNAWDVSACTDMSAMFYGAATFNQPLGSWVTSKVRNMESMFQYALAWNQPVGGWDVGGVTDMRRMFAETKAFNQDINGWDVGQVTSMYAMYNPASAFNGDINGWAVGRVNNMANMFSSASAFNRDINGWDVSQVTNMHSMYKFASAFNQFIGAWDVSKVRAAAPNLAPGAPSSRLMLTIPSTSPPKVTDMSQMCFAAGAFNQSLEAWHVAGVTSMDEMFSSCIDRAGMFSSWATAARGWTSAPPTGSGSRRAFRPSCPPCGRRGK
jgi:surface protein